jgi:hypothetical protein
VNIPVDEQLDAYTSFRTRELFQRYGIGTIHQGMFTVDRRDIRDLFSFTRQQLVDFLRANPDRVESCLERSREFRGIYDKEILEPHGEGFVLYWQDHGKRRDELFYTDKFEAAADWFTIQYGMCLNEDI